MTTSTTDTAKRLSDVELARIRERDDRYGPHKGFIGETNCDRHALLSHIAALSSRRQGAMGEAEAPQSQISEERATAHKPKYTTAPQDPMDMLAEEGLEVAHERMNEFAEEAKDATGSIPPLTEAGNG